MLQLLALELLKVLLENSGPTFRSNERFTAGQLPPPPTPSTPATAQPTRISPLSRLSHAASWRRLGASCGCDHGVCLVAALLPVSTPHTPPTTCCCPAPTCSHPRTQPLTRCHCFRSVLHQPAAIRQYLCLSLLKNSASSIPAALQLSASIFLSLLQKFRSALKAEVGVFFPMVMLKVGCGFGSNCLTKI